MGESACLVRPFSNPADISLEAKEGDPILALTESVSFGRFMSESLAWEKWSTFSHNRYLEEVEKFSKPGSVAQKKAFFEAHYKRRAAMRAAALLEQANTVSNDVSQTGTINAASMDSSLNTDSANANASVAMDEQQEKDVSDAEVAHTTDVDADNLNVGRENMDVANWERGQAVMDQDVNMENNTHVGNSNALENVDNTHVDHGMILSTPDKKMPLKECTDQENSTSSSKKWRTNSLSKSSTPCRASKLPLHPSKRVAFVDKSTGNSIDKKKTIPNSLHISINFASGASKTSKTSLRMPKDSSTPLQTPTRALRKAADQENLAPSSEKSNFASKLSNHGGVSKQATSRIGYNHGLISRKSAVDSDEQKRIVQKSLRMSMNFTPHASGTNKTSLKISRDNSTPLQTPTRASVNGCSRNPSKDLQLQDKRTRAVLNKSVSGGVTGDGRWPSLSNCSKSSSASGTSTRSTITSSPFTFRSEERAAKRKEFFKKLEDKMNSKEAEKSQMQTRSKDKAKNDLNKLRQSTDVKARLNEDLYHGSQSSCNHVKKIVSTWSQSPKFGRKPYPSTAQDTNSSTAQDTNSRPPRRPSINTESSKRLLMKNNRIACSVTALPKNRHENASPNIQHSVGKESISYRHDRGGSIAGGCSH
ncbi:PREDICTED: protein WVD2-like 7 isoform X1 [Theobroma cacao]|uniref:Protein WVD2-like 7 isoform X1 n=1 Tax=Theobroma cacao TaxID=3641 RepID=A0AB32VJN2_THECC|nr:PREDICTED: protein WVD2-like 7 isoform X1 [Theobroma cacao]